MVMKQELINKASERQQLCQDIKKMIVERLSLNIDPEWISNDQPLFGRGLELDSIDTLEIAVGLQEVFGATFTDDNMEALGSVNKIADFIEEQRREGHV
ncbi:phosphopantetheine-binding protein [Geobacillus sp. TFV-3]|uniref:phosphopantetheine-binding protein n=1 Tax=Geobacillus sp. TFV-3 TaxID=1897059 RepID=UPI001916E5A3|nr:phosphopantetheine-binding protein [Geobacillus sp. TFV-3]KAF0995275.1 Acyl carrier protein [Geobacillus sp. TFV-3]